MRARNQYTCNIDNLVKSHIEAARWLSKKFDIQGVVFLTVTRQYMWYVESLSKTYNAVDRTFYDAINFGSQYIRITLYSHYIYHDSTSGTMLGKPVATEYLIACCRCLPHLN